MIQRLYAHNFKCLEDFKLELKEMPSALLIGKNGTGKSTVGSALRILQRIGQGINRVEQLVPANSFARGRSDVPLRFEIEVLLKQRLYHYTLALELPDDAKELRVFEEQLTVAGNPIYSRQHAQVTFHSASRQIGFLAAGNLVALPILQETSDTDPLHIFKTWLARMIILSPIPPLMSGDSNGGTLEPAETGANLGDWCAGLLAQYPAAYSEIRQYLQEIMPDFDNFQYKHLGTHSKSLSVRFLRKHADMEINFNDLSDGEKCFFLCAVILAANDEVKGYGPLFCFWDEPDNYLSLSEVGHFVTALRRTFERGGQLLATSHHSETIRKFSAENTLALHRRSHLEPTEIRPLSEMSVKGDLVDALIRDDVEP